MFLRTYSIHVVIFGGHPFLVDLLGINTLKCLSFENVCQYKMVRLSVIFHWNSKDPHSFRHFMLLCVDLFLLTHFMDKQITHIIGSYHF